LFSEEGPAEDDAASSGSILRSVNEKDEGNPTKEEDDCYQQDGMVSDKKAESGAGVNEALIEAK